MYEGNAGGFCFFFYLTGHTANKTLMAKLTDSINQCQMRIKMAPNAIGYVQDSCHSPSKWGWFDT